MAKKTKGHPKVASKRSSNAARAKRSGSKGKTGWPWSREILWRPERAEYIKSARQKETLQGCVFCEALAGGVSLASMVLFEDTQSMVVMNKYPYNTGHLLVLPRRHVGEMEHLRKDEFTGVMETFRKAIESVKSAYDCHGMNIGANLGAAAGAGIPQHLHLHVVPRWTGDTNFFPLIGGTKAMPETLEQAYERLLPYFRAGNE